MAGSFIDSTTPQIVCPADKRGLERADDAAFDPQALAVHRAVAG